MEVNYFILSFVLIPLIGFITSLLIPEKKENFISRLAFVTVLLQLISIVLFITFWIFSGAKSFNIKEIVLYSSKEYEFLIDIYFDEITAVYLFVGSFVSVLITRYSAYYMHMEIGFKRFFNTILFFFLGYNFTVLSGNFETLFIGWEILGISSFLLIAFYRDRYLPVRNAVKVFSIYRIGDVGIFLAMWASHHLWHENITFYKLQNYDLVHQHLSGHSLIGIVISLGILIAASAKSAVFPFSSWLPRAMEGPTPSSAVFYGSLSVHFGVFLLLRTFPFWEHQISVRILIGLIGLITAIIAFLITGVQATIKTKIAYASIAQIGIMFIEVALGLETLALIHFAGNAFLRTYQLLVSPSIVSYQIRDQFYHFKTYQNVQFPKFLKQFESTFYVLSLKEWYLDVFMQKWIFFPVKRIGKYLQFITIKNVFFIFIPIYISGLILLENQGFAKIEIIGVLPGLLAFMGMLMVFNSFSEKENPFLAWLLLLINHYWVALAVSFNEHFEYTETFIYLSGITAAAALGFICLFTLKKREPNFFNLKMYYGHIYQYPILGLVFLISSLGIMGFPITLSFIGEDLIFSHIKASQFALAFFYSISFVFGGIAAIRMYARLFLGPHCKPTHETSLKSS